MLVHQREDLLFVGSIDACFLECLLPEVPAEMIAPTVKTASTLDGFDEDGAETSQTAEAVVEPGQHPTGGQILEAAERGESHAFPRLNMYSIRSTHRRA